MKNLLVALIVLLSANAWSHDVAESMATAAKAFLSGLPTELKAKATFDLKDEERQNWHYVPKDRKGVTIKEMSESQRKLARQLLASGLSQHGYAKATNIMALENILRDLEGTNRRFPRDPELYHFWVFGKPDPKGTWGWRVEGHHLSVNFTIVKGEMVSGTPSFFGTNPAEVKSGPSKGLRILAEEEDLARKLIKSLSAEQRKKAIFNETAPKEIFTEAQKRVKPLDKAGIPGSELTKEQRSALVELIKAYVHRNRSGVAEADMTKIEKAGIEKILFAWAGGIEKGEGHYYRVQGPTFLLEYDNTQNNNNHIHAVWRDFAGDFGEDLLQKHYRETPH